MVNQFIIKLYILLTTNHRFVINIKSKNVPPKTHHSAREFIYPESIYIYSKPAANTKSTSVKS